MTEIALIDVFGRIVKLCDSAGDRASQTNADDQGNDLNNSEDNGNDQQDDLRKRCQVAESCE